MNEYLKNKGNDGERLIIEYNNGKGRMQINMNEFFPTSQARLKKLLKIVALDWHWEKDEIKEYLKVHFQDKIAACETEYKVNGKGYAEYYQKVADTQRLIEDRKRPNGVPLKPEEVKAERENLKVYKSMEADYLRTAKKYQRKKKQYSDNLEYINSL